jgi:acetoin utilization protein AcuC
MVRMGKSARIPFFYHPEFARYDFGATHPFRGERFPRFMEELETRFPRLYEKLDFRTPERSGNDLLLLAHTQSYIDRVEALEKRRGFLSLDTQLLPGSVDAARLIVGSSAAAAVAALGEGMAISFGGLHHAGPDYGEGFCIFNDVAVAAKILLEEKISRVMILDTDAHQGNGTMDIFYEEPRVLFVSLHQDPRTLYPGRGFVDEIGSGAGEGFTVNIPMPVLADGPLYHAAMEEIVLPLVDEFAPEVIIRNGGSDPLHTDVLTRLGLSLDSLAELTRWIVDAASKRRIPLVDLFVSGYGPYVTTGWFAILRGLLREPVELELAERERTLSGRERAALQDTMRGTLEELKAILGRYWSAFR